MRNAERRPAGWARSAAARAGTAGLGFAVVAAALLIVPPASAAGAPVYVLRAPFAGAVGFADNYSFNSTWHSNTCRSLAQVTQPAKLSVASGRFTGRTTVLALADVRCRANEQASTAFFGAFTGPNFTSSARGIHVARANLQLGIALSLVTRCGRANASTADVAADYTISIYFELVDRTTGSVTGTTSYSNSSYLQANQTVSLVLNRSVSLPILVPLTKGDVYYFVLVSYYTLYAQAGPSVGLQSASGVMDVGGPSHPNFLKSLVIH